MNTLKQKSLYAAVAAGLAAVGAVGTAEAVHINPDGLGQVLIFPYYTVRGGQNTLITLINTQNNTKAVKVRFLEGRNSREVLDFNLFLSPSDVWTGAIIQTTNGARVVTNDNSCVTPSDLFLDNRPDTASGLQLSDFKNFNYGVVNGSLIDSASFNTLDRTREGYFEVIEMGVIDDDAVDGNAIAAGTTAATVTGFIKHNSAGVPANCAALNAFDSFTGNTNPIQFPNTGATIVPVGNLMQAPRGGITGRASILNASSGANFTFSPTAFDAWTTAVSYSESGNLNPAISGAFPTTSNVFTAAGVVTTNWGATLVSGRNAMSATMMRNTVINEFLLDAGTASRTDWVVTFPTKRFHIGNGSSFAAGNAPFTPNFPNSATGACDGYGFSVFNREEGPTSTPITLLPNPSPLPPGAPPSAGSTLCWEANVVPFGATSLLSAVNTNALIPGLQSVVNGSTTTPGSNTTNLPGLRATQGPNGYLLMNFNVAASATTNAQALVAPVGGTTRTPLGGALGAAFDATYNGLPVVGFMVHNYQNAGVSSLYGGLVDHKFTRSITP